MSKFTDAMLAAGRETPWNNPVYDTRGRKNITNRTMKTSIQQTHLSGLQHSLPEAVLRQLVGN